MYKKNKEWHLFVAHQVRITRAKNALIISPVNPLCANRPIMSICASTKPDFCNKFSITINMLIVGCMNTWCPGRENWKLCLYRDSFEKKNITKVLYLSRFCQPHITNITKVPFVAEMSRATSGSRVYLRCTFAACRRSYSICLVEHIEKRKIFTGTLRHIIKKYNSWYDLNQCQLFQVMTSNSFSRGKAMERLFQDLLCLVCKQNLDWYT